MLPYAEALAQRWHTLEDLETGDSRLSPQETNFLRISQFSPQSTAHSWSKNVKHVKEECAILQQVIHSSIQFNLTVVYFFRPFQRKLKSGLVSFNTEPKPVCYIWKNGIASSCLIVSYVQSNGVWGPWESSLLEQEAPRLRPQLRI